MGEDVPLELRGLEFAGDLRTLRGGLHVLDLQVRYGGVDASQLFLKVIGLVSLRHRTS
ncbi:hypothetical protein [Actinoplanes utahensis]|uniref:hypothetical protein n=1 Tax=Actinoplanes utahensis TaxID=1869 RepID=UPI001F301CA9|nr:hypothetical protein [Actinoplanes utahensis]